MKKSAIAFALAALLLAGCEEDPNLQPFDGVFFETKTSRFKDGKDQFTVTVDDAGQTIEGALAAGTFEGTRYCIANYGTSTIRWEIGPDTPREQLALAPDGSLTVAGRCDP